MSLRNPCLLALLSSAILIGTLGCDHSIEPETELIAEVVVQRSAIDALEAPEFRYHSYDEVREYLVEATSVYPELARLGTYGQSAGGRPLYVLALGQDADFADDPNKPNVLLNYAIHGDELITVESAMHFVYSALTSYGEDPRTTSIFDEVEIFLVPVVSPDGFTAQSRRAEGVDPNRQFPHSADPDRVGISVIERAKALNAHFGFIGVLDFHAFGELIMLPYGGTFERPGGFDTLTAIGNYLAEPVGYRVGQISHLFNSTAQGGSNDYYFDNGAWAIGVELGQDKVPPAFTMPGVTADATEIAYRYLEIFSF